MVLADTGKDSRITRNSLSSLPQVWPCCSIKVAVLALTHVEAHLSSRRLPKPQWAWFGDDPV